MADKKFITVVHNALNDAEKIDAEMKEFGSEDSFIRDGKMMTFPTSPIRLCFIEGEGDVNALHDRHMNAMQKIWENLGIKSGAAFVLVGDDWST